MTCSPSQMSHSPAAIDSRSRIRSRATMLLAWHGSSVESILGPQSLGQQSLGQQIPGQQPVDDATQDAGLATALMDLFRRTADKDVFDCLVQWVRPQLQIRVRSRLRSLGAQYDPNEILQDAIVNIYRYPDRFLASRPGAFAAWSSTIVDNAIRRQLRLGRRAVDVSLRAPEVLQECADGGMREPSLQAQDHEECAATVSAFGVLLQCYLSAYSTLNERERLVLQMVEVGRMRYGELATSLGIRPEALKMVVFRARKRIFDRVAALLRSPAAAAAAPHESALARA